MNNLAKYQDAAAKREGLLLSTKITNRKLKWQCSEGHVFYRTGLSVYRRGRWCNECGLSKGERAVRKALKYYNITFEKEYSLEIAPRRRYDFYFFYKNRHYFIEFDGEQHFFYVRKYHKKKSAFIKSQIIDRLKTYYAWNSGVTIIRIDYTQINNVDYHIQKGINSPDLVYFSTPDMYKYITEINIKPEDFKIYTGKSTSK